MAIILSAKLAEIKNMAKPGLEPAKRRFNFRKSGRCHFLGQKDRIDAVLFLLPYERM